MQKQALKPYAYPIHHAIARNVSFFTWLKEIREEFRENEQASQPMDNQPWEVKAAAYEPTFRQKLFQSPVKHLAAFQTALELYKLGWTNPSYAAQILRQREEALQRDRDIFSGKVQHAEEEVKKVVTTLSAMETDLMKVTERVRALMPEKLPADRDGVIQAVKAQEGNIKELAVDRLEVMGASISEFMSGYREGKAAGVAHINSPEGDQYFASFDVMSRAEEGGTRTRQRKNKEEGGQSTEGEVATGAEDETERGRAQPSEDAKAAAGQPQPLVGKAQRVGAEGESPASHAK